MRAGRPWQDGQETDYPVAPGAQAHRADGRDDEVGFFEEIAHEKGPRGACQLSSQVAGMLPYQRIRRGDQPPEPEIVPPPRDAVEDFNSLDGTASPARTGDPQIHNLVL
jgi:hypothetical protein